MKITPISEKKSNPWASLATGIGCGLAVILFLVAVSRLGLLNGLLWGDTAATSAGVAHLISKVMQFGPDTLRVQVGEAITLQLDNKDLYAHSFDIDALDVHAAMPANSRNTLNFKAHHPGKFSFYCSVPGHQAAGMVRTIIVEN